MPKINYARKQLKKEKTNELDIFTHLNSDNLNYIRQQLSLKRKKNIKQQEQDSVQNIASSPEFNQNELINNYIPRKQSFQQRLQDLKQSGSRSAHIKKDTYYEQTNSKERNANIVQQKQQLEINTNENKQTSIDVHLRQIMSTNLKQMKPEGEQFLFFLQGYIEELNNSVNMKQKSIESKHLVTSEGMYEENSSNDFNKSERINSLNPKPIELFRKIPPRISEQQNHSLSQYEKQSRYQVKNEKNHSKNKMKNKQQSNLHTKLLKIQQQLKQQKLNCILLAQQVQKYKQVAQIKEQFANKLQYDFSLMNEEVIFLRKKLQIVEKNQSKQKIVYSNQNYPKQYYTNRTPYYPNSFQKKQMLRDPIEVTSHLTFENESVTVQKLEKQLNQFMNQKASWQKHNIKNLFYE